jgi:hypothetical protein
MKSANYLSLFSVLIFSASNAFSYQAYWTDVMQRNFSNGAKIYDQTLFRIGSTVSKNNKAIWGKIDQIQNKEYGPAQSVDGGGFYRFTNTSTTLGLGWGNDYHLRSNRLYIFDQRIYFKNDSIIPLIGVAREEYLGVPQSYFNFIRIGIGIKLMKDIFLNFQTQKIENNFSDKINTKKGFGNQFSVLFQHDKLTAQLGLLRNCLGENQSCHGSRETYSEYLSNVQIKVKDSWAVRMNASYIKQSSRFVSPFSNKLENSPSTHSEIIGVGIIKIIP